MAKDPRTGIRPLGNDDGPDLIRVDPAAGTFRREQSEIKKGLRAGGEQLSGIAAGVQGVAAGLVGADEAAENYAKEAGEYFDTANLAGPRVKSISDIGSFDDAVDWAFGTLFTQVPMMATLAAGGPSGIAGRALVSAAAKKVLPKSIASSLAKTTAKQAATAGVMGSGAAMESGAIYPDIMLDPERTQTPGQAAGTSLLFGAPAGALEAFAPLHVLNKFGLGKSGKRYLEKSLLKAMGKTAASTSGIEAGTEGVQTILERSAAHFANENREILGEEGWNEVLNAIAAGGLVGGTMGGIGGGLSHLVNKPNSVLGDMGSRFEQRLRDIEAMDELQGTRAQALVRRARDTFGVDISDLPDDEVVKMSRQLNNLSAIETIANMADPSTGQKKYLRPNVSGLLQSDYNAIEQLLEDPSLITDEVLKELKKTFKSPLVMLNDMVAAKEVTNEQDNLLNFETLEKEFSDYSYDEGGQHTSELGRNAIDYNTVPSYVMGTDPRSENSQFHVNNALSLDKANKELLDAKRKAGTVGSEEVGEYVDALDGYVYRKVPLDKAAVRAAEKGARDGSPLLISKGGRLSSDNIIMAAARKLIHPKPVGTQNQSAATRAAKTKVLRALPVNERTNENYKHYFDGVMRGDPVIARSLLKNFYAIEKSPVGKATSALPEERLQLSRTDISKTTDRASPTHIIRDADGMVGNSEREASELFITKVDENNNIVKEGKQTVNIPDLVATMLNKYRREGKSNPSKENIARAFIQGIASLMGDHSLVPHLHTLNDNTVVFVLRDRRTGKPNYIRFKDIRRIINKADARSWIGGISGLGSGVRAKEEFISRLAKQQNIAENRAAGKYPEASKYVDETALMKEFVDNMFNDLEQSTIPEIAEPKSVEQEFEGMTTAPRTKPAKQVERAGPDAQRVTPELGNAPEYAIDRTRDMDDILDFLGLSDTDNLSVEDSALLEYMDPEAYAAKRREQRRAKNKNKRNEPKPIVTRRSRKKEKTFGKTPAQLKRDKNKVAGPTPKTGQRPYHAYAKRTEDEHVHAGYRSSMREELKDFDKRSLEWTNEELLKSANEDLATVKNNKEIHQRAIHKKVNSWAIKFKLILPEITMLNPEQAIAFIIKKTIEQGKNISKEEFNNLHATFPRINGFYADGFLYIRPDLTTPQKLAVAGHEVGHAVYQQMFINARADVKKAVIEAYEKWRAQFTEGKPLRNSKGEVVGRTKPYVKATDIILSKQPIELAAITLGLGRNSPIAGYGVKTVIDPNVDVDVRDLSTGELEYLLDFEEWFADNVSKYVVKGKSEKPETTLVERFFRRVGNRLRYILGKMDHNPDAAVDAFLRGLETRTYSQIFGESHRRITEKAKKNLNKIKFSKGVEEKILDAGIGHVIAKRGLDNLDARHAIADWLDKHLTREEKRVLSRAMTSAPQTYKEIEKHAGPYHVNPMEYLAVGTQLWAKGKIDLGPKSTSVVRKYFDALIRFLGIITDNDKAGAIMSAIMDARISEDLSQRSFHLHKMQSNDLVPRMTNTIYNGYERIMAGVQLFFYSADSRMQSHPALQEIANLFHARIGGRSTGEATYFDARTSNTAKYNQRLEQDVLGDLEESSIENVLAYAQNGYKGVALSPEEAKAVRSLRRMLDDLYKYAEDAGVSTFSTTVEKGKTVRTVEKIQKRPDYFPRVWDVEYLVQNKDQFVKMLNKNKYKRNLGKEPLDAIDNIYNTLLANNGYGDTPTISMDENIGLTPAMSSINSRTLGWIEDADAAEFMQQSLEATMVEYISQVVKRAEYTRRFGANGEKLQSLLNSAKAGGATDKELETADAYIEAMLGKAGRELNKKIYAFFGATPPPGEVINPKLQAVLSSVIVFRNLAVLGLSTFTSLADVMGIAVRGGDLDSMWVAFRAGADEIRLGIASIGRTEPLSREEILEMMDGDQQRAELHDLASGLGVIDTHMTNEALEFEWGGTYMSPKLKKVNEAFFKLIMLTQLTRLTRVMALASAKNFLRKHGQMNFNQHSQRWMDELGIHKGDVRLRGKNKELIVLSRYERQKLHDIIDEANAKQEKRTYKVPTMPQDIKEMSAEQWYRAHVTESGTVPPEAEMVQMRQMAMYPYETEWVLKKRIRDKASKIKDWGETLKRWKENPSSIPVRSFTETDTSGNKTTETEDPMEKLARLEQNLSMVKTEYNEIRKELTMRAEYEGRDTTVNIPAFERKIKSNKDRLEAIDTETEKLRKISAPINDSRYESARFLIHTYESTDRQDISDKEYKEAKAWMARYKAILKDKKKFEPMRAAELKEQKLWQESRDIHKEQAFLRIEIDREKARQKRGEKQPPKVDKKQEAANKAQLELDRDTRVRNALFKWVDGAILRPNAAQRPIWASDPHWMTFFHLKSFMYTYHDRILRRAYNEMKHGNFKAWAAVGMYVPAMIAIDALRDWLRFGPDGNPRHEYWSYMDYTERAMDRSGVYGVAGQYISDAITDREFGGLGWESALGATFFPAGAAAAVIQADERKLLKYMPAESVFREWVQ